MARNEMIICKYCNTVNRQGATACLACGAPLEIHQPASKLQTDSKPSPIQTSPEIDLKKVGEKADKAYFTVLNTYAIAWRTVAEAIAIAIAAFIIGTAGGAAGAGFWAILGGIALGIAVGLSQKNFYITLISAPVGALLGLGVGAIFWAAGISKILPLIITLFSILGAVIGGKPQPAFTRRNWWEKLRPVFGGLGGLVFGILGTLLGYGIWSTIQLFR